MKRILFAAGMVITVLVLIFFSNATLANENIYGLRIENINRSGADFYWSTSIETKGSVEYAYTKLAELYNPQLPGSSQDVLLSVTPLQTRSEDHYVKEHHIRVDNLDIDYHPFVQYTIKSQAFNGEIYSISGEFVLVDTKEIHWWQTWQFAISMPIIMFILGLITKPTIWKIREYLQSIRESKKEMIR